MTDFAQSKDHTRTRTFIGQCCWLVLYGLQLMMMALYEMSDDQYIDGLSVFLGAFVVWAVVSWRITMGRWVDLYSVFFIALFLFSGGQAVLNILGLMPQGILDGHFSSLQVKHALTLVVGCLLAFHTGALLRARRHAPSGLPVPAELDMADAARQVGLLLILVSLGPGLYDLYQDASIIRSIGYGGQFFLATKSATGMGAWTHMLTMFLVPGALLFLAGSKGRPINIAVAWAVIAVPAVIYFLLGIRNVGIRGLVALLWLHSVTIRPIRKSILVGSTLIVLVLIPGLEVVRGKALTVGDTITALQHAYSAMVNPNPLVLALAEMGGTLLTVIYTTDLVPTVKPYEWGMSYVMALTTVFPNLFWDIHPAIKAGLPSYWLMKEIDPFAANAGFSLGYSMIAEAYLNFSWIGAPIAMAGLGYFLAGFVCWVFERPDALRLAMQAILMSFVLFVPRAESQQVMRELFWVGFMLYLFVLHLAHRRIRVSRIRTARTASPGRSDGRTTVCL